MTDDVTEGFGKQRRRDGPHETYQFMQGLRMEARNMQLAPPFGIFECDVVAFENGFELKCAESFHDTADSF
ncbi:MAG: hypothetical protein COV45_09125 [Deltaproteobacteria bacterium CG11_big_fil_rev_8_21_14_0_20_47_16]|nr:MAG: hypothetical protein COV45_09125 [Deltaproteobacteria bacterium CG11_big_fil_rev_8_21_14_0_20_47_16]